jgi:hypothetical protein
MIPHRQGIRRRRLLTISNYYLYSNSMKFTYAG